MAWSHLEIQTYKHSVLPVPKGKANLLRVIYDSSLRVISSSMRADVPCDTNKYSKGTCCLLMTEHRETGTHFHYPSLGPSYVRIQLQLYLTHLLPKETFSGLQDTQLETTINLLHGFPQVSVIQKQTFQKPSVAEGKILQLEMDSIIFGLCPSVATAT